MNLLPVVERELRVGARQTLTYTLRVAAVAALLTAASFYWVTADLSGNVGGELFQLMHRTLLAAIWVLVPLLTADCISRERREGTLALLFLTPLRPPAIVMAKATAHGVRAFTLWLAALPALTIPFIAGGVSWKQALISTLVSFSSLCLAMAAGLVVSARSRNAMRSLAAAGILSLFLLLTLVVGMAFLMESTAMLAKTSAWRGRAFPDLASQIDLGFVLLVDWDDVWARELIQPGFWPWAARAYGATVFSSFLIALWLVLGVTARTVARVWREEPPSARVVWLQRRFTSPILFQRFFKRWMRWELQRNPVGWLERRSWSARLSTWGWIAVVASVYSSLLLNGYPGATSFYVLEEVMAWLMVLNVAVSAAGSFRPERENGVLELLLVAPLKERQVIGGRLRGLWGKFLVPEVFLVGLWFYCGGIWQDDENHALIVFCASTFATLPVIGLFYSLARTTFMTALVWTLLAGIALPAGLAFGLGDLAYETLSRHVLVFGLFRGGLPLYRHVSFEVLVVPIQIGLAVTCFLLMLHHLKHRKFAMS